MFYFIQGKLALLDPTFAVLDVGGVGYKLTISQTTHDAMPPHLTVSETPVVKLLTYMAVREDGIELYGFATQEELSAFKMLISVSGVGPKAAMSILSLLTPEKFAIAVCTDDKKTISKANGIGPKTAARVILELKDKLTKETALQGLDLKTTAGVSVGSTGSHAALNDAVDALMVLGYSRAEAMDALRGMDSSLPTEDLIRMALKKLMKG
jgi:Holliday junction DNA helicase RuvA